MLAFAPLPLTYLTGSFLTAAIALQSKQSARLPLLVVILTFTWLTLSNLYAIFTNPDHADCFGVWLVIWCLHIVNALFIEKYTVPLPHSPTPTTTSFPEKAGTISSSWNWLAAYKILYNLRWVNTRNAAPGMPIRKPMSRNRFLVTRLVSAIAIYACDKYLNIAINNGPWEAGDFNPERESVLRRLGSMATREYIIRSVFVFNFVWGAYAMLEFVHRIHAFVSVLIGIDEPEDWPPFFGSILETYTMRRFWGKFWHRIVYRCYDAHASIFTKTILGIKEGSPLDRKVRNALIFLLSGCAHGLVTWRLGFTCGYLEDVWWFLGCLSAIYIEDAFFATVTTIFGKGIWKKPAVKTWGRLMGYCWVGAWFWWTLLKTLLPKIRCAPAALLPDAIDVAQPGMVEMR